MSDIAIASSESACLSGTHTQSRSRRLRLSTREAHDAIEAVPCMRRLLAHDYTLHEYRMLLMRLVGYVAPMESRLAMWADAGFNLATARTPKLLADLSALGVDSAPRDEAPVFDIFDVFDDSTRAGIVYVFEGATLGGQVIRRALTENLGQAVAGAVSYFDCYGGAQGQVWRRTIQQIETADIDEQRMIATARRVFRSLGEWLSKSDVPMARRESAGVRGCPFAHLAQRAED